MNDKTQSVASIILFLGTEIILAASKEQKSPGPPPLPANAVALEGSHRILN